MTIRDELLQSLTFILRRTMPSKTPKGQWWKRDEAEAAIVAERAVAHLELSGFTFGKRPPAQSHSWSPPEPTNDN